jgi:hypothetical protein
MTTGGLGNNGAQAQVGSAGRTCTRSRYNSDTKNST